MHTSNASTRDDARLSVDQCWRAGDEFAFLIEVNGVPVVEQFLRYEVGSDGDHIFSLFWRIKRRQDSKAMEAGAELRTDGHGLPISYETFSSRDVVRKLTFTERGVSVLRRDGSQLDVATAERIGLVLQGNDILHLAIILPMLRVLPRYRALNLSPSTLAQSKFAMQRDGMQWSADRGLTFDCDAAGRLRSFEDKDGVAKGRHLHRGFPDVNWARLRRSTIKRYRAPRTIIVREITVPGKLPLGAALTLPRRGRPPYPAFLFLQGSGRHDRHGISPSLDTGIHEIVDGLAACGIAGLRFNSRGAGSSLFGDAFESGIDARLADSRAALRSLAARPEIDAKNLFVMGHSLGSMIAIQLAASAKLRGAVLLAPPGRRIDRIVVEQMGRALERHGLAAAQVKLRTRSLSRSFTKLWSRGDGNLPRTEWGLTKLAMADLMRLEPIELIAKVRLPLLICQGTRDIQVSLERDALPLFLRASEVNYAAELVVLAAADHLFRHEIGTSSPERYFVRRPLAHGLLETLEGWMKRHTKTW